MICIILVAGHGVLLEREIQSDPTGAYSHLVGIPKALLPARSDCDHPLSDNGNTILDYWWKALKSRQRFSEVYLVTNADKYKYYERWASAHDFPLGNIINDGSTTYENSLGAIADVDLAIRSKGIKDDIMVVAGDMLFSLNFDIGQIIDFFKLKQANLSVYYELSEEESTESRGIVEVDQKTGKITKFLEKPHSSETSSRLASPVFYCLKRTTLPLIDSFTKEHLGKKERALGRFMSWLVGEDTVYGMKLPTRFQLIGQVGLSEYNKWIAWFQDKQLQSPKMAAPITCRSYARIGFIGNPSDGYNGKTISLSIANFWADVTIMESSRLKLTLHPLNDPTEFGSLSDLYGISVKEGYLGGLRLLQATCKKFYQYCAESGIALARKNFTLKYDTNIPRQVGLAGSSAIITCTLRCLMKFFGLTESDMPKALQPNFILDVEMSELFIQAGLQDRVIQVYEGLVYMDFDKSLIEENGHGNYEDLSTSTLPPLWLAYLSDPSDSGKIHSNVKQRWLQGDQKVIDAMSHFAKLTDQARTALNEKNYERLFSLLNENFDTRLSVYGKEALGSANLEMISIARKHGSCAKFCGSGGAIFGLSLDEKRKCRMAMEFQEKGYVFCDIQPFDPKKI